VAKAKKKKSMRAGESKREESGTKREREGTKRNRRRHR
jgi:hypothetical protein